jgi:ubiquinone/menaquinone biosynthesis C-methylase UbiE
MDPQPVGNPIPKRESRQPANRINAAFYAENQEEMNTLQKGVYWLDRHTSIFKFVETRRASWFVRRFPPQQWISGNESILDVGCGVGDITRRMAMLTSGKVIGIDREDFRRKGVREEALFGFHCVDAEQLPFEDESFDLVTLLWVLHHAERPERILREAARVLRHGGQLVLTEDVVDENSRWSKGVTVFYDSVINLEWDPQSEPNHSVRKWGDMVLNAGPFTSIRISEEPMSRLLPFLRFGFLQYKKGVLHR